MNEDQPIIVCTHDNIFHADEVMACALLRLAAGGTHVAVIRSRLAKDWERADYILDVGGKHDGIRWFDHHQPESTGNRDDGTGFSCFGLLWKAMGVTMVRTVLEEHQLEDAMLAKIAGDMELFVKGIDLHDQGALNVTARWTYDRNVYVEVATLQTIVSGMNPIPFMDNGNIAHATKQFYSALDFATEFLRRLVYKKASRAIASKYVSSRIQPENPILYLEEYCEWFDEVKEHPHIMYVVYPSANGKAYAVQAVKLASKSGSSKTLRMPFPADWAGLTDEALVKMSGVKGALFCHRDRFIASASTMEGAYLLATTSIKQNEQSTRKVGSDSGAPKSGPVT